jgi:hypothetical protein
VGIVDVFWRNSPPPIPQDALAELAAAQLSCLDDGECAETLDLPSSLETSLGIFQQS